MGRRRETRDLDRAAKEVLGYPSLRSGQPEALTATLAGRDVLAVMPTGHGKSALYQLPAALCGGLTVVVSPLIALQRDQAAALREAPGAPAARVLNSTQRAGEADETWSAVAEEESLVLFLAPEQLAREEVLERLGSRGVGLLVVDEAHCISAWGHDFRPDYLRLGAVVQRLGHPTVLALTATASPPAREEIVGRLGLRDPLVLVRGFDRPNLHLDVRRHVEDKDRREAVVETVASLPRPGLLYVATRKDTTAYAEALSERGLASVAYHGGMPAAERREAHDRFSDGTADVVVATTAFGMGIDKADIRFVVHGSTPETPEGYYQEIGRAGRDGEPAEAVLFYRPEDFGMHRFHAGGGVDEALLSRLMKVLRAASGGMATKELAQRVDVSTRRLIGALNLLEQAGAVRVLRARVRAEDVTPARAVRLARKLAESRERVVGSRMDMMRAYAETTGCRRRFLLGYLGEELEAACGSCDTCADGTAQEADAARSADTTPEPFPTGRTVEHREWGPGLVMSTEPDRLTVLFESEGYRTLSLDAVQEDDLLTLR